MSPSPIFSRSASSALLSFAFVVLCVMLAASPAFADTVVPAPETVTASTTATTPTTPTTPVVVPATTTDPPSVSLTTTADVSDPRVDDLLAEVRSINDLVVVLVGLVSVVVGSVFLTHFWGVLARG